MPPEDSQDSETCSREEDDFYRVTLQMEEDDTDGNFMEDMIHNEIQNEEERKENNSPSDDLIYDRMLPDDIEDDVRQQKQQQTTKEKEVIDSSNDTNPHYYDDKSDDYYYEDKSDDDMKDNMEEEEKENDKEEKENTKEEAEKEIEQIVKNILNELTSKEQWKVKEHILVKKEDLKRICLTMMYQLNEDGPFLKIGVENEEIRILGDIHGQYEDMVNILRITEQEKPRGEVKHLFLGDYVDRGTHSFEVCLALFCWKILFPDKVYLLRGNHEISSINCKYGFQNELIDIYGEEDGKLAHAYFNSVFQYMPVAAVVHDKYFCVHGGLSKRLVNVESLNDLVFPIIVGPIGQCMINDMLWADPSQTDEVEYFLENSKRGPVYGSAAVEEFCKTNKLEKIIRGHQVANEGYWTACNERCVNIFSAPNYRRNNKAAVLSVTSCSEQVVTMEKINGKLRACV